MILSALSSLLIILAWNAVVTSKPISTKFKESVYRNGTCYNNYTNILIELNNGVHTYTLATICHNEATSETLFVKHILRGADLDDGESISRPSFKEADFYPDVSADECYTQAGQWDTVAELLGSEDLADEYVPGGNTFLSRGHLAPNGDGIEAYEKKATFYFVNVVGQWQSINGGNWVRLEEMTRKLADQRQSNLTIYTGGIGVTTLNDVNSNPVEIWLGRHSSSGNLIQKIPVPHSTWKVIHDEVRNEAVVIIQINNPWNTVGPADILCPDICDELSYVTWDTTNVRLGYTYCCDVATFAKAVPYAPQLGSLPLLQDIHDRHDT